MWKICVDGFARLFLTLIKNIRSKAKSKFSDHKLQDDERRIWTMAMAEMIHSTNVSEATEYFILIIKLYGSEFEPEDYKQLVSQMDTKKSDDSVLLEPDEDDLIFKDENSEKACTSCRTSPYYKDFFKIRETTEQTVKVTDKENKFYAPELINYLMEFLVPYFDLWSATCIAEFNLKRDCNASVESYFKIYKYFLLNGMKHLLAPRFIMLSQKYKDARLTERTLHLKSSRSERKMSRKKKEKQVETEEFDREIEVWVDKKKQETSKKKISGLKWANT